MPCKRTLLSTLLFEKNNNIKGGIYHRMQIDFAYNSNHIEGSRLTYDQTRYIFETHTVDGVAYVNDVFEAANHFKCFDYILETVLEPITEEYVKHLHKTLKNGLMTSDNDEVVIGDYKKYPNEVGQIQTVLPEEVSEYMKKLLNIINSKDKIDLYEIAEFHADFEKIHPFYDGNGRVGRLLVLKQCLLSDIVPFFINDEFKHFYYVGLKEWQINKKQNRLLDVFLSMQDDMKVVLDYFKIEYDKTDFTARQLIEMHTK